MFKAHSGALMTAVLRLGKRQECHDHEARTELIAAALAVDPYRAALGRSFHQHGFDGTDSGRWQYRFHLWFRPYGLQGLRHLHPKFGRDIRPTKPHRKPVNEPITVKALTRH